MITFTYVDLALYGILLLFALRNIWVVVIQHKEYKTLTTAAFYTFAMVALPLRLAYIIGIWTDDPSIYKNIDLVQQGALLCIGIVQDWVTVELNIRVNNYNAEFDAPDFAIRKLHAISKIIFLVLIVSLSAYSITVIVIAHQPGNDGIAYSENTSFVYFILAYILTFQVIVMGFFGTWLIMFQYVCCCSLTGEDDRR